MVSDTFKRLAQEKQARVQKALLAEFSAHPFADAQVARIVADAGIARGAFYKYFDDLTDAYGYLFRQVMVAVHRQLPQTHDYYAATAAFVTGARDSVYQPFLRQHFEHNQGVLALSEPPVGPDAKAWAITTLCHETLRAALVDPGSAAARLAQLKAALALLNEEEK